MKTPKKKPVLEEAMAIVKGPRRAAYGHPRTNFETTGKMWSAYLSQRFGAAIELSPKDVTHMMGIFKYSRLANDPNHPDSLLDIAGYVACAELCDEQA